MTTRVVAAGADRFRRPGAIERMKGRLAGARLPLSIRRPLKQLYHLALTIQSRGQGLPCELPGGEVIRVMPRYDGLSWNPDEYQAFREAVRPGMVALDVGANVGAYATLLGHWVGPDGSVFAFEPAPAPFDGLTGHIRLNGLERLVRPIRSAVGERSETGALMLADTSGESRLTGAAAGQGINVGTARTIPVPVTTIDDFCAREHIAPDFIKVDVEGGELAVLRGARETVRARRGALALFVELHPSLWQSLGYGRDDLIAELRLQQLEAVALIPTADVWAIEGVRVRLKMIGPV